MEADRAARALAEASAAMTRQHDVAGGLAALMDQCRAGLGIDASGILVVSGGRLELLASSSHDAAELDAHQMHTDEGPCIEAHATSASVQAHATDGLAERWPGFAQTMLAAGFHSVHASPLIVQGSSFGALGLFRRADEPFTADEDLVARAFADIATMLVLHHGEIPADRLAKRLTEALGARVVVEQAKGVLADAHDLTMADAYQLLVQSARDRHLPLTEWADQVIREAQRPQG